MCIYIFNKQYVTLQYCSVWKCYDEIYVGEVNARHKASRFHMQVEKNNFKVWQMLFLLPQKNILRKGKWFFHAQLKVALV